jgi:hypothetical protein
MIDSLIARMNESLDEAQGQVRDLLYYTLERVLRSVYESFQHVVSQSMRAAARADSPSPSRSKLSSLTALEIQHSRRAVAEFETRLNSLTLNGQLIAAIRRGLKSGSDTVSLDPKLFAEVSSCLRTNHTFDQFVMQLKRLDGLQDQYREEIIAAVKTAVEPFRSLYYVKINFVRYLKGLKKFQGTY